MPPRTTAVVLPHDWLSWQIGGRSFSPTTDRGDASGTCYFDATANRYRNDLVELALGHDLELPRVAAPNEVIGYTPSGIAIAPGTGDNMAGGLGLGVATGAAVVSAGHQRHGLYEEQSADPRADRNRGRLRRCDRRIPPLGVHAQRRSESRRDRAGTGCDAGRAQPARLERRARQPRRHVHPVSRR